MPIDPVTGITAIGKAGMGQEIRIINERGEDVPPKGRRRNNNQKPVAYERPTLKIPRQVYKLCKTAGSIQEITDFIMNPVLSGL